MPHTTDPDYVHHPLDLIGDAATVDPNHPLEPAFRWTSTSGRLPEPEPGTEAARILKLRRAAAAEGKAFGESQWGDSIPR